MIRHRAATPLFLQALGLVLVTLLAAWLTTAAVVALLPSPVTDLYRMSDLSEAVRTGQNRSTSEGRTLIVSVRDRGVADDDNGGRSGWVKSAMSEQLGIAESRLALSNNRPTFFGLKAPLQRRGDGRGPPRRFRGRDGDDEPFLMGDFKLSLQRDDGRYVVV